ncbi:MAG: phenylalanine--tRNA ligase subunit beta, partial [Deinococcota bacterium]|nr:phenylalanine--tRNA ligase subunit beta [Deinococcota bacterium]
MNLPYSWLAELLPELPPAAELADLLAGIGLGVERVYELPGAPGGVVVARLEEIAPVEGSDHLLVATASDGSRVYSVVTGAPNTRAGMLTALAGPGAVLSGGVTVSEREVAGVKSEGVLCSPAELGLYDYGGGLLELGDDVRPGQLLAELWPGETILELEITPNRADAFSLLGVARDLAAKLGLSYRHPAEGLALGDGAEDTGLRVEIEDPAACPRFTLRLIQGVTVRPSPLWLQRRLAAVGLRPRNNVVDVTNYVTFELGQPSHAYDRADLTAGSIVVRRAQEGEGLLALDEARYDFSVQDLLITTPDGTGDTKPIGVAGVIGGLHHSVKGATQDVALEVAHFDPVTVRKTAKRLGLSTEASYRFERGVDPDLPPLAAARAAALIAELGGGRLHP